MSMTCPKCHGEMRQYERSGVVIDQCGECRGIFLDRGELEKLFEAEANWSRQQGGTPPPPPVQQPGGYPGQPGHPQGGYPPPPPPPAPHQPGYGAVPPPPPAHGYPPAPAYGHSQQHHGYHGHYKRKKHKGFLDEMFG
ncbi:TFIIB-type zinc ribbon-containing protein [Micromonospora sp. CPCC 205561]|uniref:TFIIB-type zinc ribbon-containing protein n=1 Tax=Micromonospora sp. CPCC 205561 TaxID=3122407 RepID=UPI002FF22D7A